MKQLLKLSVYVMLGIFISVVAFPGRSNAATACTTGAISWSSTSNTITVKGSDVSCTPQNINQILPNQMVYAGSNTYLLRANLKIINGATLDVIGTALSGGTTNELRLLSNNSGATNSVVNITADYGKVNIKNTKITSWDEAVQGPDTAYATYNRAFIRVRSSVLNGTPLTSRMDIADSDIGYLGYNGSEAYGLSWKVLGSAFSTVDVLGDVVASHIHGNYFGIYTYGAYGMNIDSNDVDHNIKYGIDTHDDSDYLNITRNESHDNGNHGIICSQRCDHLTISNNQTYNNVGHGIMLHRSTDDTLVENNIANYNTDTGIALFESNNNTVRNNYLEGNKSGVRLSVGSSFNSFTNNTIYNSTSSSIYTYKGSDVPTRGDGINRNNTWDNNNVSGSRSYVLKLNSTDGDSFITNDFRNNPGGIYYLGGATNTTYAGNLTDPGVTLPQ